MSQPARLIREYQPGQEVTILSEARRFRTSKEASGGGEPDPEEVQARLEQARRQAAALLQEAQAEAAALLQDAQTQVTTLQAEAQARGYEEGYRQGIAEGCQIGENSLAEAVAAVQGVLHAIGAQRAAVLAQAEPEVVSLAAAIVEKLMGRLVQQQRSVIVHNVHRALARLSVTGPFRLRVHPDDAAYLEACWRANPQERPAPLEDDWTLVGDRHIEPGGCIVECGPATVDATLHAQMRAIAEALDVVDEEIEQGAADDRA